MLCCLLGHKESHEKKEVSLEHIWCSGNNKTKFVYTTSCSRCGVVIRGVEFIPKFITDYFWGDAEKSVFKAASIRDEIITRLERELNKCKLEKKQKQTTYRRRYGLARN